MASYQEINAKVEESLAELKRLEERVINLESQGANARDFKILELQTRIDKMLKEKEDFSGLVNVMNGGIVQYGDSWQIRQEGGVLVVRDIATEGDHRYAFYPGKGNAKDL